MTVVSSQWSVVSKNVVCFALCVVLFALCGSAESQQSKKVPRIGYLTGPPLAATVRVRDAFRQGLRELGYIEGNNIVIEWRSWEGKPDRQQAVAAEFVRLKVDVIVAVGSGDIRAAKKATTTIPIVMVNGGDAVGSGLVASLARPGGNVTGMATLRPELSGKRLELLKETASQLSRVALFASTGSGDHSQVLKEVDLAAKPLGMKVQHIDLRSPKDFESAFHAATKGRAEAVLVQLPGPILTPRHKDIVELAVKTRLPVMYERTESVEVGGLMSYGVNSTDRYRRAATYVDKILKGTMPADLPVEQPTKFELQINLKAAQQIGLTIPPNVLARADRVIR